MQRELQEDGEQDVEIEDIAEGPLARELLDRLYLALAYAHP